MSHKKLIVLFVAVLLASVLWVEGVFAASPVPKLLTMTAHDVSSSTYVQMAAMGAAFRASEGVKLRVIPSGTDVGRMAPLRAGEVDFAAASAGIYAISEGLYEFGNPEWGPQKVRLIWMNYPPDVGVGLATTLKTGIDKISDIKGRRVASVPGSSAVTLQIKGLLAFGGLTYDDVVLVEFPSYGATFKGLKDDKVDIISSMTDGAAMYELADSPRGVKVLPVPKADKEGWLRLLKVAPYMRPQVATKGPGDYISKDKPLECVMYPSVPSLIAYDKSNADTVYHVARLVHQNFDRYKNAHPSMPGWNLKQQVKPWIVPYHEGSVKYLREIGWWTEADEKTNNWLINRQRILRETFDNAMMEASEQKMSVKVFHEYWLKKREEVIKSENIGLETILL